MAFKIKTELNLDNNKIITLAPGTNPTDAVNLSQLEEVRNTAGERNTGEHIGVGLPVYAGMSGDKLQFYGVRVGSLKVTVQRNGNDLVFDIVDGQIDHNSLLNYRAEEHRKIDDSAAGNTDLLSAFKIYELLSELEQNVRNEISRTGRFQGGYDATANAPDLIAPTDVEIDAEDTYVVQVAGDFYGIEVTPGDYLIANIDNPQTADDWTVVEIPTQEIAQATTEVSGLIEIATQAEVNEGTDATRAVTPATLTGRLVEFNNSLRREFLNINIAGSPAAAPVILQHDFNRVGVKIQAYDAVDGETIICETKRLDANRIQVSGTGTQATINVIVS